jgi:hypothetical protein
MSNKKELLDLMKESLTKLLTFSKDPIETKMGSFTLVDGTVITSVDDVLAVGSIIMTVDVDGNETPAIDGSYQLEDGTIFTVVEGAISEITPVATAESEVPEVEVELADPAPVDGETADEKVAEESTISDLETRLADLESKFNEFLKMSESQSKFNEEVSSSLEKYSAQPDETKRSIKSKSFEEMSSLERFNYLRNK